MIETFSCQVCGVTADTTRSDAEAVAEMRQTFGDLPAEHRVIVCDECYPYFVDGNGVPWPEAFVRAFLLYMLEERSKN